MPKMQVYLKILTLQNEISQITGSMATILLLETATEICSVAIAKGGKTILAMETADGYNHSEKLTVFIGEVMKASGIQMKELDAVCVCRGPGSYTGLRIGVSAAKGICYALDIPLLSVGTLDAMAHHIAENAAKYGLDPSADFFLCPMLDARRMEVYTALYDRNARKLTDVQAHIVEQLSFQKELTEKWVVFFGNGAPKCKTAIHHPNAVFLDDVSASAQFMSYLAEGDFNMQKFEDVAYFEPYYLKDFVATIPRNKLF
jgi:tRNA threonylcarbamoyladenosine biosynthesis protein TsaB